MRTFFRGLLVFLLIIGGIVGVITVDVRSGHMAGYDPTVDITLNQIDVEEPGDSFAFGYALTMKVNNERILEVINNWN